MPNYIDTTILVTKCVHRLGRYEAWEVQVNWNSVRRTSYVYDRDYENTAASFKAAVDLRDEMEIDMGKPRTERRICADFGKHNKTKIPGVYRSKLNYVASYCPEPNKFSAKSFSISKYGEQGAKAKAEQAARELRTKYYYDVTDAAKLQELEKQHGTKKR